MAFNLKAALDRMDDLENFTPETDYIGHIYGGIGVGKTVFTMELAQELAAGEPIIYLDSADGYVTLKGDKHKHLLENVHRLQFKSYDDLAVIPAIIKSGKKGDVAVVVIDEFSSMAESVLDTIQRQRLGTADEDIPRVVPEWTDYRPLGLLMRKAVEQIHDIGGVHVLLVSHAKEKVENKLTYISPSLNPDLLKGLNKIQHSVAYLWAEISGTATAPKYERKLQTMPSALVVAKSRITTMPVRVTPAQFIEKAVDWVYSDQMPEDTAQPERSITAEDVLRSDGLVPAAEEDEPVYAGEPQEDE